MKSSLFSIFDPSTVYGSLNWTSLFFPVMIISVFMMFSLKKIIINRLMMMFMLTSYYISVEFVSLVKYKFKDNIFLFTNLMMFIMISNLLGLLPYVFTSFSHLVISLSLSLSLWTSFMLYGWISNTNHMFIHLLPMNTPYPLMILMILIESISNFIRPWTLAIRLSANMVAGHLLLSLLGGTFTNFFYMFIILLIVQNMLMFLEICVSIIQSYVFSMLSVMYFNESNN